MPILTPEVEKVLASVGLSQEKTESLPAALDDAGLTLQDSLNTISHIMDHGDTDAIRLQAARTALELKGLLTKKDQVVVPTIVINIKDSQAGQVNPILIPREVKKEKETVQ